MVALILNEKLKHIIERKKNPYNFAYFVFNKVVTLFFQRREDLKTDFLYLKSYLRIESETIRAKMVYRTRSKQYHSAVKVLQKRNELN